jgi:ubiquinone/menaquinone biosynthesis C-methylase UbiE
MKRDEQNTRVTTRDGYAAWAGHYDDHDNPMTAMVEHVLAHAPVRLDGANVLELGCGTGRNAVALRGMGSASYLGIDNSPEMLDVARSRVGNRPDVRFAEGDLRGRWWSELATFDVVIVSLVFEHFDRIDEVIDSIGRVVRDGGSLWVLEIHPQLQSGGVGAHVENNGETLVLPSFAHTAQEFASVFGETGWEPVVSTDWYGTDALTQRSAKLARYRGRPVLLEVRARRSRASA